MTEDNEHSPSIDDIDPLRVGKLLVLSETAMISGFKVAYLAQLAAKEFAVGTVSRIRRTTE